MKNYEEWKLDVDSEIMDILTKVYGDKSDLYLNIVYGHEAIYMKYKDFAKKRMDCGESWDGDTVKLGIDIVTLQNNIMELVQQNSTSLLIAAFGSGNKYLAAYLMNRLESTQALSDEYVKENFDNMLAHEQIKTLTSLTIDEMRSFVR